MARTPSVATTHTPSDLDQLTLFVHEVRGMAHDLGPLWAIIILIVVFGFLPRIGYFPYITRLIFEDRKDARSAANEHERLVGRYENRRKRLTKARGGEDDK